MSALKSYTYKGSQTGGRGVSGAPGMFPKRKRGGFFFSKRKLRILLEKTTGSGSQYIFFIKEAFIKTYMELI